MRQASFLLCPSKALEWVGDDLMVLFHATGSCATGQLTNGSKDAGSCPQKIGPAFLILAHGHL